MEVVAARARPPRVRTVGLRVGSGVRTGGVTLIQRFGSAPNLDIHLHLLFVDGAHTSEDERPLSTVPSPLPNSNSNPYSTPSLRAYPRSQDAPFGDVGVSGLGSHPDVRTRNEADRIDG